MDGHGLYAPRSPDLSSFFTSPSKTQQQTYHPPIHPPQANSAASYTPQSPTIPSFNNPAAAPTSTYNNHHHHHSDTAQDILYSHHQQPTFPNSFTGTSRPHNPLGDGNTIAPSYDQFDTSNTQYNIPDLPPQHTFSPHHEPPLQNFYAPHSYPSDLQTPAYLHSEDSGFSNISTTNDSYISSPISYNQTSNTMSRRAGKQNSLAQPAFKSEYPQPQQPSLQSQPAPFKDPNPTNIQISTKFPTARIKRIMQADEEVGKVAQVTPPAVNKALELFMIALVTGAAEKAKEKGGKRITAQHLKQVVLGDDQFDFLAEIVGKVEEGKDEGAGTGRKRKTKKEEGSDSSDEAAEGKKKKGKGGRKKKVPDE